MASLPSTSHGRRSWRSPDGTPSTRRRTWPKACPVLRPERPDYAYVKKVFQHTRALLAVKPTKTERRLPELLTDAELVAFYEAVWQARNPQHMVLIKLLLFTGLRNIELAHVRRQDVELDHCHSNSHFDF